MTEWRNNWGDGGGYDANNYGGGGHGGGNNNNYGGGNNNGGWGWQQQQQQQPFHPQQLNGGIVGGGQQGPRLNANGLTKKQQKAVDWKITKQAMQQVGCVDLPTLRTHVDEGTTRFERRSAMAQQEGQVHGLFQYEGE